MNILGISAYYHDSAAALLVDSEIGAAAQEERFTRRKHDPAFPHEAIRFCLEHAGLTLDQIDNVVFYDKPLLKFERLLETNLAFAPHGYRSFLTVIPVWLREKLYLKDLLRSELREFDAEHRLLFSEHHLIHAASAFFPSPFDEAVVLTMDGVGEWTRHPWLSAAAIVWRFTKEIHFPHSIGLFYSAFTYYIGQGQLRRIQGYGLGSIW